jgi:uncharacterized protein (DUF4415 family)
MKFVSFQSARRQNMKRVSAFRKSRTDVRRLRQVTDATMVKDGDVPEWTPAMFARALARKGLRPVPKKVLLSLRVDADVIDWFKAQGAGYQSRMNALLRAFMEAHEGLEFVGLQRPKITGTRARDRAGIPCT